jgi:hypothetical protein
MEVVEMVPIGKVNKNLVFCPSARNKSETRAQDQQDG